MLLFPTFFIVVAVVVAVAVVAHKGGINGVGSGGAPAPPQNNGDWLSFGNRRPDATPEMLGSIEQAFMDAHNQVRQVVGVPTLQWNFTLEAYAQNYAAEQNCVVDPSDGPYGENIFWGIGDSLGAADAVNAWANEAQNYDYPSNTCGDGLECDHYTQVVWKDSTDLGCAVYSCSTTATYVICEYNPKGNVPGQRPF